MSLMREFIIEAIKRSKVTLSKQKRFTAHINETAHFTITTWILHKVLWKIVKPYEFVLGV